MLKWLFDDHLRRISAPQLCILVAGLGLIFLTLKFGGTAGKGLSLSGKVILVVVTFVITCVLCVLVQERSPRTHKNIGEYWCKARRDSSICEMRALLEHIDAAYTIVSKLEKSERETSRYWATYGLRLWTQFAFGNLLAVVHQFETMGNEDRRKLASTLREHPKDFAVDYYPAELLRTVEKMVQNSSTDETVREELLAFEALLRRLTDDRRETDLRHVHCRGPILGSPEVVVAAPETQLPPMPCLARVLTAGPPDAGGDHHGPQS